MLRNESTDTMSTMKKPKHICLVTDAILAQATLVEFRLNLIGLPGAGVMIADSAVATICRISRRK